MLEGGRSDGDTKICKYKIRVGTAGIFADEDIRGFDVAVNDRLEVLGSVGRIGHVAFMDKGEGFGQLAVGVPCEGFRDFGAVFEVAVTEVLKVAEAAIFEPESVAGEGLEIANQRVGAEDIFEDNGFGGFVFAFTVIGHIEAVLHDFAHNEFVGVT